MLEAELPLTSDDARLPWQDEQFEPYKAAPSRVVGGGVQDCVNTGEPPVQPEGDLVNTVLVCWPFEPQADHAL
jgi:hypothetical protein